ncbi:hypothetical protein [Nocardiopsis sp. NRRL B-16309]|uniref:hypothetical protein n=1 Tax=Nocardiopsis sp. NRRL B-16309 TaxID=1519494 RepID=UPI0006C4BC50|nr:hypothetical protein [Nocardiopsis sp. NRRL B-16309]KOX19101.1 hypothetical protein ADL05_06470 [Nocardiopsis sp. NRRL B-16309]
METGDTVPRLSHTFDLTPVAREVVGETVAAAYEVARSCRFDGRGWLLTPDEETLDRLEEHAASLGLSDREAAREARRERREAAERLRTATDLSPEEAETLRVRSSVLALQLQSGHHLAPRAHYHVAELTSEGVPLEPVYAEQGWSGTGVTVLSWDEHATSRVEYAMPDTVGSDEPPVTSGTVTHDAGAGLLTATASVRLPGRGAWLRSAEGSLTVDTHAWYAALAGESGPGAPPPARVEAAHRLVDITAWLSPSLTPDGRWSVEAVLDARGRGPFRPFMAMVFWAIRTSFRREERAAAKHPDRPSPRRQLAEATQAWDRVAANAAHLPGYLREVAKALAAAGPKP